MSEKQQNGNLFRLSIAAATLSSLLATPAFSADLAPRIESAIPDYDNEALRIVGENLSGRPGGRTLKVSLTDEAGATPETLDILTTDLLEGRWISVTLPPREPGDFKLVVCASPADNRPGNGRFDAAQEECDEIMFTVAEAGPPGPQGPQGPEGVQGPAGPSGANFISYSLQIDAESNNPDQSVRVECPQDLKVMGGGCVQVGPAYFSLVSSGHLPSETFWECRWALNDPQLPYTGQTPVTFHAFVNCVQPDEYY